MNTLYSSDREIVLNRPKMTDLQINALSYPKYEIIDPEMDQQEFSADFENEATEYGTPAIFSLNIDCFAKIFDYLSLVDLMNVGQTCKLMNKVAGHIFQMHYPHANAIVDEDGDMHLENHREVQQYVSTFSEYIQCIVFSNTMSDNPTHIEWQQFKSIKRVNFYYSKFNAKKINWVKDILENVEIVELSECNFYGESFEQFLGLCKNIKNLIITISYGFNPNWLSQKYPHLESLSIVPYAYVRSAIYELHDFFKQNRNVCKFFTSSKFLLDNHQFIMQAKFDQLKVQVDEFDFATICALLSELHAKGVYKRFYITFFDCFKFNQSFINRLNAINALVGLRVPFNTSTIDLCALTNLEVLQLDCDVVQIINKSQLTQSLTHLREISFVEADVDDLLPFVYRLPTLRKISVEKLISFRGDIDLLALNENRRRLFTKFIHVSKVIIYIPEYAYLKIRKQFVTMNLDCIEILRYELYNNVSF